MKRLGLLLVLVFIGSNQAHAGFIDLITGADMAGMEVTATFADGSQETATWAVVSNPQPVTAVTVPQFEVYSGEAAGTDWSLYQQGRTFGDVDTGTDPDTFYGEWVLSNDTDQAITSLVIDALAGGILFDNVFGTEETPGSSVGRPFSTAATDVVATYSSPYPTGFDDLWGVLTLTWLDDVNGVTTAAVAQGGLADGGELRFQADTDKIPLPGTILLMLIGSLGLAARANNGRVRSTK